MGSEGSVLGPLHVCYGCLLCGFMGLLTAGAGIPLTLLPPLGTLPPVGLPCLDSTWSLLPCLVSVFLFGFYLLVAWGFLKRKWMGNVSGRGGTWRIAKKSWERINYGSGCIV